MKTILIVLGSLFFVSRMNGAGSPLFNLGGNAAPGPASFTPTPPGGAPGSIIPGSGDPYAGIQNLTGGSGGSGIPVTNAGGTNGGTGSFHTQVFTQARTNAHVVGTRSIA